MRQGQNWRSVVEIASGQEFVFSSPYEEYSERVGQRAVVVREVDHSELDFDEVGAQWIVRFDDGAELTVWPEEIDSSLILGGLPVG
jgi:hypothetical protein